MKKLNKQISLSLVVVIYVIKGTLDKDYVKKLLKDYFNKVENLEFALIFGSLVKNNVHFRSDVDIAVSFDKKLKVDELIDLLLDIAKILDVDVDDIDIVDLKQDLPYSLRFEIVRYGEPIVIKDREAYLDYRVKSINLYLDLEFMIKMHKVRERFLERVMGEIHE